MAILTPLVQRDAPTTPKYVAMPRVHNKHHKTAPPDAVYVGRGSKWGNPYKIGEHGDRDKVIELYAKFVLPHLDVTALKGKHLVCYCKPAPCHGDLLFKKANNL